MVVWVGDQGQLNGRVIPPQHFLQKIRSPFMLHHLIIQTKKKTSRMVFHPAIQYGFCFRFPNLKNAPKKIAKPFNDFETGNSENSNAWVGSIGDVGSHLEVLGQERGFLGFVYIHQKLNGTKTQRSPFSKWRG